MIPITNIEPPTAAPMRRFFGVRPKRESDLTTSISTNFGSSLWRQDFGLRLSVLCRNGQNFKAKPRHIMRRHNLPSHPASRILP
jgi:hypothetical protein